MRARKAPTDVERPVGYDGHTPVPLFADVHNEAQREAYLDALRQGIGLDLAARQIDTTASRIRMFAAREPEFQQAIEAAQAEGREHYAERLRAAARVIALRTNPGEVNARILEVELATHGGPAYAHLRRDRVKHEGKIEHALVLDASRLDDLPLDELVAVREALSKLAAVEVIDQPPRRELNA